VEDSYFYMALCNILYVIVLALCWDEFYSNMIEDEVASWVANDMNEDTKTCLFARLLINLQLYWEKLISKTLLVHHVSCYILFRFVF